MKNRKQRGTGRARVIFSIAGSIAAASLLALTGATTASGAQHVTSSRIDQHTATKVQEGPELGDPKLFALSRDRQGVYALGAYNTWIRIGGPAAHIYAGINKVYATNPKTGDIYRWNGSPDNWTRVGGPGNTFCVGREVGVPALFGLNGSGVFELKDGTSAWRKIGGPASGLYCAAGTRADGGNVYATNPNTGEIYGTTGHFTTWSRLGGPGRQFAADAQSLYGLNDKGVFLVGGDTTQIGGPAANIYAGGCGEVAPTSCRLLATDPKTHDVYLYYPPTGWHHIGGPGSDFKVDHTGGIFGLSPGGGRIYVWNGGLDQDAKWSLVGPNGAAEIAAG